VRTALVIPSLGSPRLGDCLRSAAALEPPPERVVLVLSGGAAPPPEAAEILVHRKPRRLGYAAAVNCGLRGLAPDTEAVAVLNDDALPGPGWLGAVTRVLERHADVAAVQGTVVSADGSRIDGRGITFDPWGLPVQLDRDRPVAEDHGEQELVAVSGTACVFRLQALHRIILTNHQIFDEDFDCYHEDLDLGLRLRRAGWSARWTGGAPVRHLGSASGGTFAWRHPWWLLANRWRALAGNLTPEALLRGTPRFLRGDLRAINTLARSNVRAVPTAAGVLVSLPMIITRGWLRSSTGQRLGSIPETVS
jgi:GT2 family glycosyltransferase